MLAIGIILTSLPGFPIEPNLLGVYSKIRRLLIHSLQLFYQVKVIVYIAVATKVRTLGSKGVWGLCPQPGVPPLHPVLTNPSMAIHRQQRDWQRESPNSVSGSSGIIDLLGNNNKKSLKCLHRINFKDFELVTQQR